jgi:hypothetical protein
MAEAKNNIAVSYKVDSRSVRTVTGFASVEEATIWLRWSSTMDRAIRGDSGQPAAVDIVTVAAENKANEREGWNEYLQQHRAEKARQAEEARLAHEAKLAEDAEAAREAEIQRLVAEKFKADRLAQVAKWRKQAEEELAKQGQT